MKQIVTGSCGLILPSGFGQEQPGRFTGSRSSTVAGILREGRCCTGQEGPKEWERC